MTPFFNENNRCQKCGGSAASKFLSATESHGEVIQRDCHRCGFSWMELPLDTNGMDAVERSDPKTP